MPIDEPRWWYEAPDALAGRLLRPVGSAVATISELRWKLARPYRSSLTVVCVGNFTAGGTGKTPTAVFLADTLRELGGAPVFLSRGYGGANRGPHRVDPDRDTAHQVGDEPLLLARCAPTFVARRRAAGALAIENECAAGRLEANVVVMDDGMQNPSLRKDLSIALVDGGRGFGNGRVLPAGPLRAPIAAQLARVDAVIINRRSGDAEPTSVRAMLEQQFGGPILEASVAPLGDTEWLRARPLLAFAGIGNPQRFFSLVEDLGGRMITRTKFADHHFLDEQEAERLLAEAEHRGATIVTTEKDLARLSGAGGASRRLQTAARALPIAVVMNETDRARLCSLLRMAAERRLAG